MSTSDTPRYKIVGAATWELIRAAYLAGDTARECADRFGVTEWAIRKRITSEGWTKRDYAAALEARGLEPPAKPAPFNVAERFAANYAPPPAPPPPRAEEAHPFLDLVAALKQASAAAETGNARALDAVAEAPAEETAAALERRALAQVGAALSKGKAQDARALAALAEQMRKRAEAEIVPQVDVALRDLNDDEREALTLDLFAKVAFVAGAMVHAPHQAPAAFQGLIAEWRRHNLGEGEADAAKAAARIADSQAAYVSGEHWEMIPPEARARMERIWAEQREQAEPGE